MVIKLSIPEDEITLSFSRSGGAGGQNVNKVSSKVTLWWNLFLTRVLTERERTILLESREIQKRLDKHGNIIISEEGERSQLMNRHRAVDRLNEIVSKALIPRRKRIKTKPSRGMKERRLKEKKQIGERKRVRQRKGGWE